MKEAAITHSLYNLLFSYNMRKLKDLVMWRDLKNNKKNWHSGDCASWYILIIKPTRCTNFSNLFLYKTLHVLDSSSVHHQEFFTAHTAMVCVIQVCWQLASRIRTQLQFRPDPAHKLSANLYDIYHWCAYSAKLLMMDGGTVWNM